MKRKWLVASGVLALILWLALMAACAGPAGPARPQGPPGEQGPAGLQGPPDPEGPAGEGTEYAASETCSVCHSEIYDLFMQPDHTWKLNKVVDGQLPNCPFTEIPELPEGYTWNDVAYIIGGYNWKARFIDQNGYIITGDADAATQCDLPNEDDPASLVATWAKQGI